MTRMAPDIVRPDSVEPAELESLYAVVHSMAIGRVALGVPAPRTPALVGPDGSTTELPDEIFDLVVEVVDQLRAGNAIALLPLHAELTTVQAAEQLNVSRPHLTKLLKAGEIPFTMVGTHRRIRLSDVLAYRDAQRARAEAALVDLTREAESEGLYEE